MVLQNIVDYYLNQILKNYIEDYSSDQFNLKFGIAELNNLKIKLSAINVLDLPVQLKHGFIGNLTLKVNFKNIYSTQLSLSIKDVYLVFVPNLGSKYNEDVEKEKLRAYKKSQLSKIEQTLQSMSKEVENLDAKDDSLVMKILLQIFNNVQVRIENVHIRLEDSSSNIKTPFAFGITFSNLVFITPDQNNRTKFELKNKSSGIFKIAVLSNFGLYFNCYEKKEFESFFLSYYEDYDLINNKMKSQISINENSIANEIDYVLEPINFNCNVFIHRKPYEDSFTIPTADIEMNLDKFALDLNRKQFETLIVVVDNINRLSIAVAYKKWRPELKIKDNCKLWWQFAITCILETEVRRNQKNWDWNHIKDHIHKRKKYKELYKKKLLSDKTRDNLEQLLLKYEDEFDVLNLTIVRNQARLEIKDQLEEIQKEKERKSKEKKDKGWFGGWWSSSKNEEDEEKSSSMNLIEEVKKEFSDENEKEKLFKAINYDENQSDLSYPLGYAAQKISFSIKTIYLTLTDNERNARVAEFYLNEVNLNLSVLPASSGIDLSLAIYSIQMFGLSNKKIPVIEPILNENSKNMLEVNFVLNPILKDEAKYDLGVKVKAQGLKFVYDKHTITSLVEMLSVTQEVSLDELQTIASLKLNEFKQRSAISLEYAIENHKKLNLSLDFEPSFILIPETGEIDKANNILLISLGCFNIKTKLLNYDKIEFKEMIDKTPKEKLDLVRNSAYENYLVNVSKIQLILSDKENWKLDLEKTSSNEKSQENQQRNLIYPISMNIVLSRCIIMDDPDLALMKIEAKIPDIQFIIEHQQILNLLKVLLSATSNNEAVTTTNQSLDKSINQPKSRVQEVYQSNVIEVVKEKNPKQQFASNQIKLVAEFSINKLLVELKNQENIILRCIMSDLFSEIKLKTEISIVGFNLESIQFFCCMNYYHYINQIQTQINELMNSENQGVIKEIKNETPSQAVVKKKQAISKKDKKQEQTTILTLNMGRVDFIMIEDFNLIDGPAVIFNMMIQLMFRQKNDLINVDLRFINTQMAITEINKYLMDSFVELFILKPCEISLNANIENEEQHINLMIEEIIFSVSPNMVQILMGMLSKLGSSSQNEESKLNQKLEIVMSKKELFKNKEIDKKSWFYKLQNDKDQNEAIEAVESLDLADFKEKPNKVLKINQQVIVQIKTINFVIESGGVSSIPLIHFNSNLLVKFINNQQLCLEMQFYMEYYNENNFSWEPIIDVINKNQWSFQLTLDFVPKKKNSSDKQILINLDSANKLEITLSNIALKVFKTLAMSFSKAVSQPEILSAEKQCFVLNNHTEMTLIFYVDSSKLNCSDQSLISERLSDFTHVLKLDPFASLTLVPISKDALDAQSLLNFSFIVDSQQFNRSIAIFSDEKYSLPIYNRIYPGTNWNFIVDVNSKDKQTRYIDFHSNVVIQNHLTIPVNVYSYDEKNNLPKIVGKIEAKKKFYLPLNIVFSEENQYVYILPKENYLLPVNAIVWRIDERKKPTIKQKSYKTILCEPIDKKNDNNVYIRLSNYIEKVQIENCSLNEETSLDDIKNFELFPQFIIRNLLPFDIQYKTPNSENSIDLKSGEDNQIIDINSKNSELRFDLNDYNKKPWYCYIKNFKWPKEDDTEILEFQSSSFNRETLLIAANFINTDENGFRLLTIFAPFWMINNTGLRLKYNLGEDLYITHEPSSEDICLACFKSKQINQKKKMQLSLENSRFSEPFPVDVVGSKGSILVKMHDDTLCFFTIDISLSEVLFTKIVKISSFYTIVSRVNFDIEVSENKIEWIKLNSKECQSLFPKDNDNAALFFKLPNEKTCSKSISLKVTASTLIEVNNVMICCNVEVTNHAVTIEIVNYYSGSSPALLINCLEDIPLDYGQLGEEDRFRLPPMSMVHFNWKNPTGFRVLIWSTKESNEIENYLDKDAFGESAVGEIFWVTFWDDNQRILLITKNKNLVNKIFKASDALKPDLKFTMNIDGLGVSLVNSIILKEICYFSISSSDIVWEYSRAGSKVYKTFSGKDIVLLEDAYKKYQINKKVEDTVLSDTYQDLSSNFSVNFDKMLMSKPHQAELRRISLNGFYLCFSKSENLVNLHLKLNRIQIDNQLDDHIFATIFCPVAPPKSIRMDLSPKPFIEFSTIIHFDENRRRFKYLSFLIQEFAVQVDLDFVSEIQNYLEMVLRKSITNYKDLMQNSIDFALKPNICPETSSASKHHYDSIHLSPLKMHLSFSLGTIESFHLPGILDYLVKSAGVTLIEFKDAVFKINCFMKENALLTDDEFSNELIGHYKAQALTQFYVIIFGLDVIGNPVGLLLGVKQGFNDLFYEPAMGIVQGPEEFAEGLVLGVRSLFSSTVGGVAGAMGKITGTLGEGISSLMDQAERKKRRERLNKQTTILQSSKNLAKGFFSGVTGLVSKPIEGVKKDGFEGLVKGVGHGVIGLVAQPTTGIIDFTSGTLNQLQRTVNIAEEVKRQRPTRAINIDGVLRSYNAFEANGREILKNLTKGNNFLTDIYISHCSTTKDKIFLITNKHLFLLKNCMFKSYDMSWHIHNTNVSKIETKENVLLIHVKQPKKVLGMFGEKFIYEVVCDNKNIVKWINDKLENLIKLDWEF